MVINFSSIFKTKALLLLTGITLSFLLGLTQPSSMQAQCKELGESCTTVGLTQCCDEVDTDYDPNRYISCELQGAGPNRLCCVATGFECDLSGGNSQCCNSSATCQDAGGFGLCNVGALPPTPTPKPCFDPGPAACAPSGVPDHSLCCEYNGNAQYCVDPTDTGTYECGEFPEPLYNPCAGIQDDPQKAACEECHSELNNGAYTALGCIPTTPTDFAATVIRIIFSVMGGIGFLLIIYGAFLCVTSKGDPKRAQACKETITAAIVGILLVIFALFIINVIFGPEGIIPGFVTNINTS